jgi:hypothetical protein
MCRFCNVWVFECVGFVMCGCFGNMCKCIFCVLYCLHCFCISFFCIVSIMCIYSYLLLLPPSENSIAVNNNNNNHLITISKSFRKYVSNITGNHKVKELQKTAILGTAHIRRKWLT